MGFRMHMGLTNIDLCRSTQKVRGSADHTRFHRHESLGQTVALSYSPMLQIFGNEQSGRQVGR